VRTSGRGLLMSQTGNAEDDIAQLAELGLAVSNSILCILHVAASAPNVTMPMAAALRPIYHGACGQATSPRAIESRPRVQWAHGLYLIGTHLLLTMNLSAKLDDITESCH
jgi:hypothetical protein